MPKVIDHAGADEGAPLVIKSNAPWIAGSFAKEFELSSDRMDAKEGASEFKYFSILLNAAWVEHSIESIEISVRSPGETIGKFVGIITTEACDDHFTFVGFAITIGVLEE